MGCRHAGLRECWETKDNRGQECGCVQVCSNAGVQGCMASKAAGRPSCRGAVVFGVALMNAGLLGREGAGLQVDAGIQGRGAGSQGSRV